MVLLKIIFMIIDKGICSHYLYSVIARGPEKQEKIGKKWECIQIGFFWTCFGVLQAWLSSRACSWLCGSRVTPVGSQGTPYVVIGWAQVGWMQSKHLLRCYISGPRDAVLHRWEHDCQLRKRCNCGVWGMTISTGLSIWITAQDEYGSAAIQTHPDSASSLRIQIMIFVWWRGL